LGGATPLPRSIGKIEDSRPVPLGTAAGCYHFATTCPVEPVHDGRVPHRQPPAALPGPLLGVGVKLRPDRMVNSTSDLDK